MAADDASSPGRATANMIKTMIGSGILTLPWCTAQVGMGISLGGLIVMAWLAQVAIRLAVRSVVHVQQRQRSESHTRGVELDSVPIRLRDAAAANAMDSPRSPGLTSTFADGPAPARNGVAGAAGSPPPSPPAETVERDSVPFRSRDAAAASSSSAPAEPTTPRAAAATDEEGAMWGVISHAAFGRLGQVRSRGHNNTTSFLTTIRHVGCS